MALEHEYSLVGGRNRSNVGRWLGKFAGLISGIAVFIILTLVDVARSLGVDANLPPTALSLVGAAAVYSIIYWFFDQHLWKIGPVARLLKIPNLNGKWCCEGESREGTQPTAWSGTMTIVQSWDRLRIYLSTPQSKSESIAAALRHDAAAGYQLLYHYRNEPRVGEGHLHAHHGFAELTFSPGEQEADGEYFNGRGRNTYGTLRLRRQADDGS